MEATANKKTHVLVLAMSTLSEYALFGNNSAESQLKVNNYRYVPHRSVSSKKTGGRAIEYRSTKAYRGIGQLEPVPQLLEENFDLTHIVILQTKQAQTPLLPSFWDRLRDKYNERFCPKKPLSEKPMSAVEFFKYRMGELGISAKFKCISLNEDKPEDGLKRMLQHIRKLYRECIADDLSDHNWKLWLDVHGAFRDSAWAMFALMQVLAAEDIHGVPKLTDAQRLIPITDVFTVSFDPDSKENRIKRNTDFFRKFTGDTFREYMNYGQYLQTIIAPCDPKKEEYTFISYRHGEAEKERVAFLGLMKQAGCTFWYDDGIMVHEDWAKKLVESNENCSAFALLLTKGYFDSAECIKELSIAIQNKGIDNILVVILVEQIKRVPDDKDIISKQASDGRIYTISKEDLEKLNNAQQITLIGYCIGSVLQAPELEETLRKIQFLPKKK